MNNFSRCVAVGVALTFAVPAHAEGFKRITSEAEFLQKAAGKKLWLDGDHVTARKNGQLVGKFGGERLKGVWAWRGQFWCRTITTHTKNTDCQVWETNGKAFRITRQKGKGRSLEYTTK
ncbi:MAG: hypothetical protein ABJD13_13055 [Paracoccaceae bacterium]